MACEQNTTVVRLPTAAARKVQQPKGRKLWAAQKELPQFTGEYLHHQSREALKTAEKILAAESSPALRMAVAIFRASDYLTQAKVMIALSAETKSEHAAQALAMLSTLTMTYGESASLEWAFKRLEGRNR
jgi:hypothetical protein